MRLVVIQQREDDDAIFTPGVRLEVQRKKRVIQTFPYFSLRRQRKVGAAPHRGNASGPITSSGCQRKAPKPKTQNQTAKTLTSTQPPPAPSDRSHSQTTGQRRASYWATSTESAATR